MASMSRMPSSSSLHASTMPSATCAPLAAQGQVSRTSIVGFLQARTALSRPPGSSSARKLCLEVARRHTTNQVLHREAV